MTIALIAYYLGPRLGIGQYLDRLLPPLVRALNQKGIHPIILSSPNALENTPALQQLSDYVTVIPELDYSPSKRYLWLATQFRQYCDRHNIKVVAWLSNPVLLPWHPDTVAVIHDVNEWKAKEKYGSRLKTTLRSLIYLDASIRLSKAVIAISQATADDLVHFRPTSQLERKLKVISNGADSSLSTLPHVHLPNADNPFILSVGRIDPAAKRLPEALQLVKALRERSGQPWELQLVGGMNASTKTEGEAFLETALELDWVHYHGHIEDSVLAQWYRQAAAVIYLSDNEGFGLPIAEAASFKKWVIVSAANQAALEVGKGAIIPIEAKDPRSAAGQVLQQLQAATEASPSQSLPTWQAAAESYANELQHWLTGASD
ncbi:MAG: glycosyltransferase [Cyanobacteria bacterium P01_D01_bin.105]